MAVTIPPHLVLARKWRPERFAELVGQEPVTRTLTQALASGRIAHAFLFTGIRGVGKTTAARILARCLNCERGPIAEPCGQCAACVEIRQGRALDVVEVDGATYRKIDDARSIIENLSYRPARDRFKIYIIDEAHQLTDQAFNALLKTLEEPPPHVKFILATTEPQKMPETILSRLQRYDFRRIPYPILLARLRELVGRENAAIAEGALTMLAREAGGSMRDAERMLETALAIADNAQIGESEVADLLGVASRSRVFELTEAILNHDAAAALGVVRELHRRGANLSALGRDLMETLRNLVIAKLPQPGALATLADLPDHEAEMIARLAAQPSQRDLLRLFRLIANAQEEILRSPYADLLMEMAVVRMATLAPVMDSAELSRLLTSLGSAGSADPPNQPAAAMEAGGARRIRVEGEVKASAPLRAPAREAPPPSIQSAPIDMPDLRAHIRSRKAALAGFMEQGAAMELEGDKLKVMSRSAIYVRYLADNKNALAELASEFYGRPIQIEMAMAAGLAPAAQPATDPARQNSAAPADAGGDRDAMRKELYADPVVRHILDELEGRLVDVRRTSAPPLEAETKLPKE